MQSDSLPFKYQILYISYSLLLIYCWKSIHIAHLYQVLIPFFSFINTIVSSMSLFYEYISVNIFLATASSVTFEF